MSLEAQLVNNPPAMKAPTCNARDQGSTPGSERYPGEGNGNPFQYYCLGNPIDRGAWQPQSKGLQRVRHDLVTKQQQIDYILSSLHFIQWDNCNNA